MGRFGRRAETARELAELRAAVSELRVHLAAEQDTTTELRYRFHELERHNHEAAAQARAVTTEPPPHRYISTPPPPSAPLSIDRVAHIAESATDAADRNAWAIEELRGSMQRLGTRLDELAFNVQSELRELGFEIERAAASSRASAAVSDLALDRQVESLRCAQIRLANEQARYEIALRTELAGLADQLRHFT